MTRLLKLALSLGAAAGIAAGGYRLGAGNWPYVATLHAWIGGQKPGSSMVEPTIAASSTPTERRVLYWKHPDGKAEFSPTAFKGVDGREYVPVYEDQEARVPGEKKAEVPKSAGGLKKVLFYRNPMGLPDTSPVPKKDGMGMDYIPVYEGEQPDDGSTVKVSVERVQRAGVRTEVAELKRISRPVRVPGVAQIDERRQEIVTLRADGFIEKLYASVTGERVKAGEPLFRVYSPKIVSALVDYRTAVNSTSLGSKDDRSKAVAGATQRLRNLGVPEIRIEELAKNGEVAMSLDWPSPIDGIVFDKKVIQGQMAKEGEVLYRIADLSVIWVNADIAERDLAIVKVGQPVTITFRTYPDEPRTGKVAFILHELDMKTRTAKVRIEVANPDHRIKHEMFADVLIGTGGEDADRIAVPTSAVIDSGTRQVVLVERGEGLFEPRPVKLGIRGDGYIEIKEGLKAGEKVVVTANFLIDAESNLKAALKGFAPNAKAAPAASPEIEHGQGQGQGHTSGPAPEVKQ
ncbi:MAG: efflux RND transporter periplasmic adaptor subunit [Hyphomicrobiaceae bacterium]